MSAIYDNWERLVGATLKRQELWELFHSDSITTRFSSRRSDFSFLPDLPFDFASPSSWYQQNAATANFPTRLSYANHLAADHALKVAKSYEVEPLAPGDILVNGKPLNGKELNLLQRCQNPPKELKPWAYWYDIHTGFWGKQGHKPSQIISANLAVGGRLECHASNGNTQVYINDREITKAELRMLKFAGVKCPTEMRLWMYDDGAYEEEGTNNVRGRIWAKAGMKLLCSVLSLPFPTKSSSKSGELSGAEHFEPRAIQKLILLGCAESGTHAIFKQAMFLYKDVPFLEDELEQIKLLIQRNLYGYICILLESCNFVEQEDLDESRMHQSSSEHGTTGHSDATDDECTYSLSPRLKAISDWLLHIKASGGLDFLSGSLIQASAQLVVELWGHAAFQEALKRKSELGRLRSVANYFLTRAADIYKPDYIPSAVDIIHAEGFPSSLSYLDFSLPLSNYDEVDGLDLRDFRTIYITSAPNSLENTDYLLGLEDVRIVIFCISLSGYDQIVIDDDGNSVNKMMLDKKFFEGMVTLPFFDQKHVLLLLTKYDLFEAKIGRVPLNQCDWFDDFHPGILGETLGQTGFHYIAGKFKVLYASLTGRKLYVAKVDSLEPDSVDAALRYAGSILEWDEEINDLSLTDYDSEQSFSSGEVDEIGR